MPPPDQPRGWRDIAARALAVLALLIAGGSLVISVSVDSDGPGPSPPKDVVFQVNDTKLDAKPTTTIKVAAPIVAQTRAALESGLRDETPQQAEQVAPGQLTQAQQDVARIKATQDPLPLAGASAGFQGCVTRYVGNQSSRGGVRPVLQVLHYTVSPNRPGWSDVNAVVALFDRRPSQASSHFVIDAEGHCAYIVPIEAKAWTQAAGNRIGISYEIINSGRESTFMATAGYAKLRSVMQQVSARTGIPMRPGSVYPLRAGIVQHKDGGLAWGGHIDITPFVKSQIIRTITAPVCGASCRKARRSADLRHRNVATHKRLRDLRCSKDPSKSHGACLTLHRRHQAIHRAARRERIRL